ncbi:M24 family metallopeptidase [Thermodesulfobacteriota bacterium]
MSYGKNNVDWQQRVDFNKLRQHRIDKAHEMMHKHGIGVAIIYSWDSMRYLTSNFNHPYTRHIPWHPIVLFRDAGYPYVYTKKDIDDYWLKIDCPWLEGRIISDDVLTLPELIHITDPSTSIERWGKYVQQIKSLMKEHGVEGLPISIDYAGAYLVKALQDAGLEVVDGNSWALEASMVKTDEEIELMRTAASFNEAGYSALVREFAPGMRENDAQAIMAKAIYQAGAEYIEGWVVCSGDRSSPRSFNYSDRVVRPGEIMSIEACHVTYCGYKVCYDRTFVVGDKPTDAQKELYDATVKLHHRIMEILKPGITTHDVARLRPKPHEPVRSLKELRNSQTGFKNHFGGMGIRWNDAPACNLGSPERVLEKNMVFAYHSIFWLVGGDGIAIENTYRVTDTGCENLCKWPFEELRVLGG